MRLLIADDEPELLELLKLSLQNTGWVIDTVCNGDDAKSYIDAYYYQLFIVDRTFHGQDLSRELITYAKQKNSSTGILVLSALGSIDEKVQGLEYGADDYLEKPFDIKELKARLNALSRRFSSKTIQLQGIVIDSIHQSLSKNNEPITLSKSEHALFFHLFSKAPQIVSRQEILDALYDDPENITLNAVDELIARLRKKLDPQIIKTIKTRGFSIEL